MVDSKDIALEKNQNLRTFSRKKTLSPILFNNIPLLKKTPAESSPHVQAVDPNNKFKPQFNKFWSFCQKNNHSVFTCYRRLNMLTESKAQSKTPTPSFYTF